MNVLARAIQAALNEANKPISHVRGEEFEDFVRKIIFPESHYILLSKTHNHITNKAAYLTSSQEPDFKFKSRKTGKEFYVEAKYRHVFHEGMLDWCKPYQLKRFREIDTEIPVYIILGTGGRPGAPESVSLIPMRHILFTRLYPSILERYRISSHGHFPEYEILTSAKEAE